MAPDCIGGLQLSNCRSPALSLSTFVSIHHWWHCLGQLTQGDDSINSHVYISKWNDEAQLLADADFVEGALLIGERPIAFAATEHDEDVTGPWILLDMILSNPAVHRRVQKENLKITRWPVDESGAAAIEQLATRHQRKPKKIKQLYHQVAANNIRYQHEALLGFGIWPTISRSNHSCAPNARLCASRQEPLLELLLATRPIARGEQICWNYFSEASFLESDWLERNIRLQHGFQFTCRCSRCESEIPPQLAMLPELPRRAAMMEQWHARPRQA